MIPEQIWMVQIKYSFPQGEIARWWIDNFISSWKVYLNEASGQFAIEKALFRSGDFFVAKRIVNEEAEFFLIKFQTNKDREFMATVPKKYFMVVGKDLEMKTIFNKAVGTQNEFLWPEVRGFLAWDEIKS